MASDAGSMGAAAKRRFRVAWSAEDGSRKESGALLSLAWSVIPRVVLGNSFSLSLSLILVQGVS